MKVFAPAKVNLNLHVTGRRDDGYHGLDSVVVFADIGDWLTLEAAEALTLAVTGPRAAGVPTGPTNLIWQAAALLDPDRGANITLEKHLPHAAGIGGGSADCAAALRGLAELWGMPRPDTAAALTLGADVPVCLGDAPARMRGIGEVLSPLPPLPPLWLVLVNPGVEVPTGAVFAGLSGKFGTALPEPSWTDLASLLAWLHETRNDLEAPARAHAPEIDAALATLAACAGCHLARMSGSGATCFGLFSDPAAARAAADSLANPSWWVAAGAVRGTEKTS